MNIQNIRTQSFPEIKIITYVRFSDHRGYFTEHMRRSDFEEVGIVNPVKWVQMNESFSRKGTIRGLHFQWNPYMGKLVRTVQGDMVDLFLDIRIGSPTFGKIGAYRMASRDNDDFGEWIWIPPGFAHGNFFLDDTRIEYLCTGEYSPECEAGISPLALDLDWSLCDPALKDYFDQCVQQGAIISDKDKGALTLEEWTKDQRSSNFIYKD